MESLKGHQKVFTHLGEVGRTTGRSTDCKIQDCCGQRIEVKWGKAKTAPCSSKMTYYPHGCDDTMIDDDSWLIIEYHKGLLLLPVQVDAYGIAEKLAPKKDGEYIPMPYNWTSNDVVFQAFEGGMSYEDVVAMVQTEGVIEDILERFSNAVMEMDWGNMIDDAISEEIEEREKEVDTTRDEALENHWDQREHYKEV